MEFGTDGVRGVMGRDFTDETVKLITRSICRMLARDGRHDELTIYFGEGHVITHPFTRKLVVGYDRRRRSRDFAQIASAVAVDEGFDVLLAKDYASTPTLSYAVKAKNADGAIIITASHNPPEFNGLKFKPFYAGSSVDEVTGPIEAELVAILSENSEKPHWMGTGVITEFDPVPDYISALRTAVDIDAIADSNMHPIFDPIHGSAQGMLQAVFEGTSFQTDEIRAEQDFNFGGVNPEPLKENLRPLIDAVKAAGDGAIGIAMDGDGDRLGIIDHTGEFYSSQVIFPLLMRHLIEHRGMKGAVARTFSVSELVDAIGRKHDVRVFVEPIGFKYLASHIVKGDAFLGGEESGGIGFDILIPERCGVLAALILLEACCERGKNVRELVDEMFEEYGRHHSDRLDLPLSRKVTKGEVKAMVETFGPEVFAEYKLKNLLTYDGTKVSLSPRGFILFRPSGTEPLLRIYAETDDPSQTADLLNTGRKLVVDKTDFLVSMG